MDFDFTTQALEKATVQEIQLELIRRSSFNAFDGEQVVASLLAHRDLWDAVMMDRFCFYKPGKLPTMGLLKLRDLDDNLWNVDTLYVLTPDANKAKQLTDIINTEDWGGEVLMHVNADEIENALGSGREKRAVVTVWWD